MYGSVKAKHAGELWCCLDFRLLKQCRQFFELKCELMGSLTGAPLLCCLVIFIVDIDTVVQLLPSANCMHVLSIFCYLIVAKKTQLLYVQLCIFSCWLYFSSRIVHTE